MNIVTQLQLDGNQPEGRFRNRRDTKRRDTKRRHDRSDGISAIPERRYGTTPKYYYERPYCERLRERLEAPCENRDQLRGFLYPDGRLTIGRIPNQRILKADQDYEENRSKIDYSVKCHWDSELGLVKEVVSTEVPATSELGLSSVQNHHSPAKARRYGLGGISSGGRKRVRESAYVLQQRYGIRRLGLYTLTCPYTVAEYIWEFNRNIAEIARRYFQELRRMCTQMGVTWSCVFVYEYQEKRYEKSGVPVLHIHYIAPCYLPGTTKWIFNATEIRYLWMCICRDVLGKEVDTSASVDTQVIQSSAVGYISKYMGKGGAVVEFLRDNCPSQIPAQWWGSTQNVKRAVKRLTVSIPSGLVEYLFYGGGSQPDDPIYTTYRRYIVIKTGKHFDNGEECELTIGMSARVRPMDAKSITGYVPEALALLFV